MRYFILIKRKGSSRYTGAIPAKKGTTINKIKRALRRSLSKKYSAKIVSESQLKRMIGKLKRKRR